MSILGLDAIIIVLVGALALLVAALMVSHNRVQHAQARNKAILSALPDLMFVMTREGVYLDYSARDESALRTSPSEFLGKNMHDIMPPALSDMFDAAFTRLFNGEEPVNVEYEVPVQSGEVRRFEARLVRCENDKLLSIVRDVTRERRATLELRTAQAELFRVSKLASLGEFAGSIAHELAQPLTAISANAHACLRLVELQRANSDELRKSLDDILTSSGVARDVVTYTRRLFGQAEPAQAPLDLVDVVNDACLIVSAALEESRIRLERTDTAEHPVVLGDRVQLRQVILNLISNAIQAVRSVPDDGQRQIGISVRADPGRALRLTVSDTGVGLTSADRERLFTERYTTKPDGMGWGLSISRSIIEAHGGRLHAEQNDGRGASFSFTLPRYGETEEAPEASVVTSDEYIARARS